MFVSTYRKPGCCGQCCKNVVLCQIFIHYQWPDMAALNSNTDMNLAQASRMSNNFAEIVDKPSLNARWMQDRGFMRFGF